MSEKLQTLGTTEGGGTVTQMKKINLTRKMVVNAILIVLACAVLYAVAFTAVVKIKNPQGVAMPFGFGASLVLSGSMEPEITTDDLVLIKKSDKLCVGDVVLYNTGRSNVLHRITKIDGDMITTQGDANNTEDKPFSKSAVLGVYIGKIPDGGKFIRFVTNPPFVMAVVFFLMLAAFTWMFFEEKKESKRIDGIRAEIESIKAENEELRKNGNP